MFQIMSETAYQGILVMLGLFCLWQYSKNRDLDRMNKSLNITYGVFNSMLYDISPPVGVLIIHDVGVPDGYDTQCKASVKLGVFGNDTQSTQFQTTRKLSFMWYHRMTNDPNDSAPELSET